MKSICASCKYMVHKECFDKEQYLCCITEPWRRTLEITFCADYIKIDRRKLKRKKNNKKY